MDLLFATNNSHKAAEVRALLRGSSVTLKTLREAGLDLDPPETGDTFVHNALQKAQFVYDQTGLPCIADDSGIEVDALDGAPGVFSKRFSKEGTNTSNNALLLQKLDGIEDRSAQFRCVLAVVGLGESTTLEGICRGRIGLQPKGEGGFGYDPLFLPDERPGRSMAELSMDDKNQISHRGRAFIQLPDLLRRLGAP
jgi:XTP/dITP diphosphohydrolase